uniref:Alkyl hydroperoxide reductase subunit C/ Thiol specific antioxidant domain-containing protein n=1 Tax=uncultured archaeon MedDCM-OCT-S05-C57 TaxID=743092 RepID=D6PBM0_9ARCH|nr:hypothetical protein [uncultured archaeon MedDCM-OCT-S05-C57]
MTILEVGKKAPQFELPNQDEENKTLDDYNGKWLVAYFILEMTLQDVL